MKKLIIATRESKLAMWQAEHIQARLQEAHPDLEVIINSMTSKGDQILDTPLAKIGGKGLFTKELETSMLNGESHIAVHSLKDVPMEFPDGLKLAIITKRHDPRDALLSEKYASIEELPQKAVVGTTSLRRRMQILKIRPDLTIKNLRGNVNTRIRKLKEGQYDAIILASSGIKRLGLQEEIKYFTPISEELMIPAMGQAALGIEIVDTPEVASIIEVLRDEDATVETTIEREFVRVLEGGCQVPIGINAKLDGDNVNVQALVGLPDGEEIIYEKLTCNKNEYKTKGEELAKLFIERGAKKLLKRAEHIAMTEVF
ncbi:MAG TPA: hydroxymethylbilane synthase [Sulfurospirillum arcachonense]|nr:hydroxymethylbilane synthase [Sulfurospirillum arcachonense]HIP45231.1 hydroxymethylbilane synthase [Sulfurospirillum arcachonense]